MQSLLAQNPFQPSLSGLNSLVQDSLSQSTLLGKGALEFFNDVSAQDIIKFGEGSPTLSGSEVNNPAAGSQSVRYSDELGNLGFADNVPRSLINTESGGNFNAENQEQGSGGTGHFGILQFSHGRLDDAKRAGIIPADMTPQQFKRSTRAQVAVSNWHFDDIDKQIRASKLDRLIGQTVGDVPLTWDGMRAMAHLGGFGGLNKFVRTDGAYNPSDSFGTSLSAYGRKHASY